MVARPARPGRAAALRAGWRVFAGGCTLEAAEAVADADLDTLQSLVEKSLLRRTDDRFWMFETIREFAAEHVGEPTRRRHAEFFLALAQSANLNTEGFEHAPQRLELALPEQANLRAAVDGALADRHVELAGTLVHALEVFWCIQDPYEGMRRAQAVLAAGDLPPLLRARVIRAFGSSADLTEGGELAAERAYEESLSLLRELGDAGGIAHLHLRLGVSAYKRGDLVRARSLLEEALARSRDVGSRMTEGQVIGILGYVAWREGDRERALEQIEQSASIVRENDFTWWEQAMLDELAAYTLELGRIEESERWALEALTLAQGIGTRQGLVYGLGRLAAVAAFRGNMWRAGRLWGAIEAEESRSPVGAWGIEREGILASILTRADDAFEQGRAEGRSLRLDEAVQYARSDA